MSVRVRVYRLGFPWTYVCGSTQVCVCTCVCGSVFVGPEVERPPRGPPGCGRKCRVTPVLRWFPAPVAGPRRHARGGTVLRGGVGARPDSKDAALRLPRPGDGGLLQAQEGRPRGSPGARWGRAGSPCASPSPAARPPLATGGGPPRRAGGATAATGAGPPGVARRAAGAAPLAQGARPT